jgi:hypothetical protein
MPPIRAKRPEIERFVRGTLGCGCPDEVFRSITVDRRPASATRPSRLQLLVGSRLLIQIVPWPAEQATSRWLETLVSDGRATRDRYGYNRFRLVIVTPADGTVPAGVETVAERFARATTGDDRAHLHVVCADQLPVGLDSLGAVADSRRTGPGTVAK